jgi:hypothetical protein
VIGGRMAIKRLTASSLFGHHNHCQPLSGPPRGRNLTSTHSQLLFQLRYNPLNVFAFEFGYCFASLVTSVTHNR